jgi:hypothetical protein
MYKCVYILVYKGVCKGVPGCISVCARVCTRVSARVSARVYQERGWPFLFKGLLIGTCPYFDADAVIGLSRCALTSGGSACDAVEKGPCRGDWHSACDLEKIVGWQA